MSRPAPTTGLRRPPPSRRSRQMTRLWSMDRAAIDGSGSTFALTLNGGFDVDVLIGGSSNDIVTGSDGDDLALLGAGDDRFIWNPGDDNDTVEGQAGTDTLQFNGS